MRQHKGESLATFLQDALATLLLQTSGHGSAGGEIVTVTHAAAERKRRLVDLSDKAEDAEIDVGVNSLVFLFADSREKTLPIGLLGIPLLLREMALLQFLQGF